MLDLELVADALARQLGDDISRVLRARHLTLKALGRRPGILALVMADNC